MLSVVAQPQWFTVKRAQYFTRPNIWSMDEHPFVYKFVFLPENANERWNNLGQAEQW